MEVAVSAVARTWPRGECCPHPLGTRREKGQGAVRAAQHGGRQGGGPLQWMVRSSV